VRGRPLFVFFSFTTVEELVLHVVKRFPVSPSRSAGEKEVGRGVTGRMQGRRPVWTQMDRYRQLGQPGV